MSFSCPHFDPNTNWCDRVHDECVCGRPGCVLARNSTFAVPPEIRLAESKGHAPEAKPTTVADEGEKQPVPAPLATPLTQPVTPSS